MTLEKVKIMKISHFTENHPMIQFFFGKRAKTPGIQRTWLRGVRKRKKSDLANRQPHPNNKMRPPASIISSVDTGRVMVSIATLAEKLEIV
jgi:hypothetical protein